VTERDDHDTSAPFSKEEVAIIREAVLTPGASVECPRCGSALTLKERVVGETTVALLWVHCTTCRRNLIVRDLPERPPTG
jgi:DNA-directed RNA polymerase subunit RPC12/RpoP